MLSRELQVLWLLYIVRALHKIYILLYWFRLQMYFDKIAELTMSRSETSVFREALVSLSRDSGLHPLVPYFSYFIADEVVILLLESILCELALPYNVYPYNFRLPGV